MLDSLVVALGLLVFFGIFHYRGGELAFTKPALFIYVAVFVLTFLFYRVLACLLAGETPGTAWMGLQLLHFDGRPADRQQRIFRLISGCLSVLPAGAGLLWALADEERLTWHDHMSKTFATPR